MTIIEALKTARANAESIDKWLLGCRQLDNVIAFLEKGYEGTGKMNMCAYLDVYGGIDNIPEM